MLYGSDSERVHIAIQLVGESAQASGQHQAKLSAKRETIKLVGLLAQVFEDRLLEHLPRVCALLNKRMKDCEVAIHGIIAETFGQVIEFSLR